MIEELKRDAETLKDRLIEWRRDFHRHPEIACQEHRTSSVVRRVLEGFGISVRSVAGTGLVGVLEGRPGPKTVALRADMDALPLQEEGAKEYLSRNPGACHACGHDGHTAILMGTAQLLAARRQLFSGKAVFLFQPSEEKIPGGAAKMIEEGAIAGVDAVFGLHLWQSMPTGTAGAVRGPMMAAADEFTITVTGKGGHGSMPQLAVDPIFAASQLVVNLQSIVSRNVDPLRPAVLSIGTIHGGTIYNIIPCEVTLSGTVRTFDEGIRNLMETRIKEMAAAVCAAHGATCRVEYNRGYPAVVNDGPMTEFALSVARDVLGKACVIPIEPVMGGEDFAYFLQRVPGAFLFFGMGDGTSYPHHHPKFDIDEAALPQAVSLMGSLALEYLKHEA